MEDKYYYIPSKNIVMGFRIKCESKSSDGSICYLANSISTGEECWLYEDAIEFCGPNSNRRARKHRILYGYETSKPDGLNPYQYVWGGQIRDSRSRSMCARPYFRK